MEDGVVLTGEEPGVVIGAENAFGVVCYHGCYGAARAETPGVGIGVVEFAVLPSSGTTPGAADIEDTAS